MVDAQLPDAAEEQFRLTFEHAPIGMALVGLDGRFLRVNRVLCEVVGLDAARLLGLTLGDITHPADLGADAELLAGLVRGDLPRYKIAKRILRDDGQVAHIMWHAARVDAPLAGARHLIVQIEDVTETRRLQTALQRQEDMYRSIVAHLPKGAVLMVDRELRVRSAEGPALATILPAAHVTRAELIGKSFGDLVADGARRGTLVEALNAALAGRPGHEELRLGAHVYDLHMVPLALHDGHAEGLVVFCHDVSERARMLDAIAHKQSLLEATLTHISSAVALLDESRRIMLANAPYADLFQLEPHAVIGLGPEEFLRHVAPRLEDPAALAAIVSSPTERSAHEVVLARPRRRVLRRTEQALDTVEGRRHLVVWHDITAENDVIVERERQLFTDRLTGIGNRLAAERAFELDLARLRRAGQPFSVAVFDVDHFKQVNDLVGHGAGDEVLRQVALVLSRCARKTDTIVRWGGEEFVALLPGTLEGAYAFCERARRQVATSVQVPGIGHVTLSAGAVEVGRDDALGDAFTRADQRLYKAKRAGRDQVCVA